MTRQFTPDWPHGYKTRDGREARVLAWGLRHDTFKLAGIVVDEYGEENVVSFTAEGAYLGGGVEHRYDLVNAPAPPETVWVVKFTPYPEDPHYPPSAACRMIADSEHEAEVVANNCFYLRTYGPNAKIVKMVEERP